MSRDLYWRCQTMRERIRRITNVARRCGGMLVLIKKYKSHLASAATRRETTHRRRPPTASGVYCTPYGAVASTSATTALILRLWSSRRQETSLIKISTFLSHASASRRALSRDNEHIRCLKENHRKIFRWLVALKRQKTCDEDTGQLFTKFLIKILSLAYISYKI